MSLQERPGRVDRVHVREGSTCTGMVLVSMYVRSGAEIRLRINSPKIPRVVKQALALACCWVNSLLYILVLLLFCFRHIINCTLGWAGRCYLLPGLLAPGGFVLLFSLCTYIRSFQDMFHDDTSSLSTGGYVQVRRSHEERTPAVFPRFGLRHPPGFQVI